MTGVEKGYRALGAAICLQAVQDYKELIRKRKKYQFEVGEKGSVRYRSPCGNWIYPPYSFEEIERFFEEDAYAFTDIPPEVMLEKLRKLRRGY